jgi:hypothetical protein
MGSTRMRGEVVSCYLGVISWRFLTAQLRFVSLLLLLLSSICIEYHSVLVCLSTRLSFLLLFWNREMADFYSLRRRTSNHGCIHYPLTLLELISTMQDLLYVLQSRTISWDYFLVPCQHVSKV